MRRGGEEEGGKGVKLAGRIGLISPLEGVEERSAQRTESQLLGFPSDERPERQRRAGSGRTERGVKEYKAENDQACQPIAYPPCFVPKSTFGGCILSSSTVKLAKGSLLRNQKVAHSTEGKVLSVRL